MGMSKIANAICNHLGLYTKQHCVRTAINIGKELVDLNRQGEKLTGDTVRVALESRIPKAKLKNTRIFTDKEDFLEFVRIYSKNPQPLEKLIERCNGLYLGRAGGKKHIIYVPKLKTSEDIAVAAHELEHYLYCNHTVNYNSLYWKLFLPISKRLKKIIPQKKLHPPSVKSPQSSTPNDLQFSLITLFGLKGANGIYQNANSRLIAGIKPTKQGIFNFLNGENYTGLTSAKRIKAYIRAICRHYINPKHKNSFKKIFLTKSIIDGEIQAYHVSDEVLRYAENSKNATIDGIRAYLYTITSKILNGELKTALFSHGRKMSETGLPTSAYLG